MSDFTVDISQNEYLPDGGDDVNAIITVTSPDTGLAASAASSGGAEIIIIDCSGSMRSPRTKIEQARAATTAKATPSRITSTAAAVAARACSILVRGDLIDPEQSMMMISAPPELAPEAGSPVSGEVTVMMALTSSPPSGRYSFWEMSTVTSLIGRVLLGIG